MAAAPEYFNPPQRTALIVDDSSLACAVLGRLLDKEGFRVEIATSGQEALERLRGPRPDVIFMDHLMPGMTGLEAVRSLKSDPRTAAIPVVMFSSQEDDEFLAAARDAGALAVLTKHMERTNLGPVLARLDALQPAREPARPATAVPHQAAKAGPAAPQPAPVAGLTRAELRAAIVPLLHVQREQIRKELLAELAILESQQEGVRRALMGRMEALIQRGLNQLGRDLSTQLAPPRRSWAGRVAWGGAVAAVLAMLAVPIGLALDQRQRLDALSLDNLRTEATLTGWRAELAAATHASREAEGESLVAVLAASGIEGPVELRSQDGSYCLERSGAGFRLTPLSGTNGSCTTDRRTALLAGIMPTAAMTAR